MLPSLYVCVPYRSTDDSLDYHVEFTFDSDVDCRFTILTGLPDTTQLSELPQRWDYIYHHGDDCYHRHYWTNRISGAGEGVSKTFSYSRGSDQQFKQTEYVVTPSEMDEDKLTYDPENDKNHFALVILMQSRDDQGKTILVVMVML